MKSRKDDGRPPCITTTAITYNRPTITTTAITTITTTDYQAPFMTTDTFLKLRSHVFTIGGVEYHIAGMDKGARIISILPTPLFCVITISIFIITLLYLFVKLL